MTASGGYADLALMLSGGGARAAYQVGLLRVLTREFPDLVPGIMTGVSAGGINAAYLAARQEPFPTKVERLADVWTGLSIDEVFRVDLRDLASGISDSLRAGWLRAFALTASSYTTGQSVTWVQTRDDCRIQTWERPQRKSVSCALSIDHVMASASLPFFFPAVEIEGGWYGDGGIRLTAPLSPAVHLGARRIIAVSTRYARSREEADRPAITSYPPPAQVAGVLYNAVFLDQLDGDALEMQRINDLIARVPESDRNGLRHIDLLMLRPSIDLGRLANEYEPALPRPFRFLTRGLGTRETRSNDMLSLAVARDVLWRCLTSAEA